MGIVLAIALLVAYAAALIAVLRVPFRALGVLVAGMSVHWRSAAGDLVLSAFPLVALVGGLALAPIALTSEVNGDFSVTFLLWWAAGLSLTAGAIAAQTAALPKTARASA